MSMYLSKYFTSTVYGNTWSFNSSGRYAFHNKCYMLRFILIHLYTPCLNIFVFCVVCFIAFLMPLLDLYGISVCPYNQGTFSNVSVGMTAVYNKYGTIPCTLPCDTPASIVPLVVWASLYFIIHTYCIANISSIILLFSKLVCLS